MTSHPLPTTARHLRERRLWTVVWMLALGIHAAAFMVFLFNDSLRYTLFRAEAQEAPDAETLRQRKEELRQRLRREQEKFQLDPDTAAALQEESIADQIDSIMAYLESLIELRKQAEAIKRQGLDRVTARTLDDYRYRRLEPIEFGIHRMLDVMRAFEPSPSLLPERKEQVLPMIAGMRQQAEQLMANAEVLAGSPGDAQAVTTVESQLHLAWRLVQQAQWFRDIELPHGRDLRIPSYSEAQELFRDLSGYRQNQTIDMQAFNDVSEAEARFDQSPDTGALDQLSMGDIYRLAVALETYCQEAMQDARAANLSLVENISFPDALAKLASLQADRPDLGEALDAGAQNMAELAEWQQLLAMARAEMMDMAAGTQSSMQASALMTQLGGLIPVESTGGGMGNMFSNFSSSTPNTLFMPNMDIVGVMREAADGNGLGALDREKQTSGGGKEMQQLIKTMEKMQLNEEVVRRNAAPGRIFSRNAETQGFLYVDTWYAIGPWENQGRVDYSQKHPPDWEINFDRTYLDGKALPDGTPRKLRWQFIQSSTIRVTVPDEVDDGTYYLYTELMFEEDMEMFMVIASDDAASVRVTNPKGRALEIWRDTEKSSWSMDEGAKKVFFSRGVHKVLVRLENGPTYASFSMLLFPVAAGGGS
jgi:hypothetical protein